MIQGITTSQPRELHMVSRCSTRRTAQSVLLTFLEHNWCQLSRINGLHRLYLVPRSVVGGLYSIKTFATVTFHCHYLCPHESFRIDLDLIHNKYPTSPVKCAQILMSILLYSCGDNRMADSLLLWGSS